MALDAKGYFHHLKSYFNLAYYAVPIPNSGELVLKEKIDVGGRKKEFVVKLNYVGEVLHSFPRSRVGMHTGLKSTRFRIKIPKSQYGMNSHGRQWEPVRC